MSYCSFRGYGFLFGKSEETCKTLIFWLESIHWDNIKSYQLCQLWKLCCANNSLRSKYFAKSSSPLLTMIMVRQASLHVLTVWCGTESMFLIFTQLKPSGEYSEGTEAPSDERMCMLRFSCVSGSRRHCRRSSWEIHCKAGGSHPLFSGCFLIMTSQSGLSVSRLFYCSSTEWL